MKKILMITASVLMLITFIPNAKAQDESKWNAGLDIYSSYIWRGLKFGTGVAFQPSFDFTAGGFTIGAWGNVSTGNEAAEEVDLFAGYSFKLGENSSLGLTVTDYYFPGRPYFESTSHFIEPMINLGLGNFSLTAAYMFYDGAGNGDASGDIYVQGDYTAGAVTLTLGGGNGQYSTEKMNDDGTFKDDKFAISNIGIGTSREIKFTDSFSLPISGSVILNPSSEQLYVVVGISF